MGDTIMKNLIIATILILTSSVANSASWQKMETVDSFTDEKSVYYRIAGKGKASYSNRDDGSLLYYYPGETLGLLTYGFYACGNSLDDPDGQTLQIRIDDGDVFKAYLKRDHSGYDFSRFFFTPNAKKKLISKLENGGMMRFRIKQDCLGSNQTFDGKIFVEGKFPTN